MMHTPAILKLIEDRKNRLGELVVNIPLNKLDQVDRERWAIINELDYIKTTIEANG